MSMQAYLHLYDEDKIRSRVRPKTKEGEAYVEIKLGELTLYPNSDDALDKLIEELIRARAGLRFYRENGYAADETLEPVQSVAEHMRQVARGGVPE